MAIANNGTEGLAYLAEHHPYTFLIVLMAPTIVIWCYVMYRVMRRKGDQR